MMTRTDQALLAEYIRGRSEAFRELLERHAGLVYGTAWRMTSDRTLAEETVQDVFCLLSRKAAALISHPSLAGWLHRTAVNAARGLRRGRLRHERKLARFAAEGGGVPGTEPAPHEWEALDAAIDRLPRDEREVVMRRFFQDMDYAQIGAALGISEPAARKRLSRGLQRLQQMIGPPKAAALTPASLAVAVPGELLGAVMAQVPAAAPPLGMAATFILMTQKPALITAALLCGGLTWFSASQWHEKQQLKAALAQWQTPGAASTAASGPAAAAQEETAAAARRLTAEMATLRAELAAEREKRAAAEEAAKTLHGQVAQLSEEVVVSYGKVSEIGNTLGTVFVEAMELKELEKNGGLDTKEGEIRIGKFIEKASSMSGLSKEIIDFEDKPEEGSQFVASFYGSVFGLDKAGQEKVADFFVKQLTDAKEKKMTLSNLPDRASPEFGPWLEKRWEYFNQSRDELRQTLPQDKQASFDQWVEKGGYGFKNLSIKGMPLMFSMGGDPR